MGLLSFGNGSGFKLNGTKVFDSQSVAFGVSFPAFLDIVESPLILDVALGLAVSVLALFLFVHGFGLV